MGVVLVGSNPGLLLYDGDRPVAGASLWTVDWSVWGMGTVLLAVDEHGWRSVGTDEHLARILLERFTRHFPEMETFRESTSLLHTDDIVRVESDLFSGLRASGGGVELRIGGVKERRKYSNPDFLLGPTSLALSNVYLPCELGELSLDGTPVAGLPRCEWKDGHWSSSSFLAVAEVWSDVDPAPASVSPAQQAGVPQARGRHLHSISPA